MQINFLKELSEHFPMMNGYVTLTGNEPKFPKINSSEYRKLLNLSWIAYHRDVQVTSGHRTETLQRVYDQEQIVDQVFSAAVNVRQGRSGTENAKAPRSDIKCRFALDVAYQGTYMIAIVNKRSQIFLTMMGGGAFGNKSEWIYDAIIEAHKKFALKSSRFLQKVNLVAFNPDIGELLRKLASEGISYDVIAK
eukprot:TRINITY_DN6857_c0_g1_i3.p1 TRINITY_DN6857_c0_g1~~TRINITY_DN6857_c0_g1_i3.p1  ORF type:complete len:193 (+),score=22.30 TRINITY_DN6857_c0_g1_i3:70-648(+)